MTGLSLFMALQRVVSLKHEIRDMIGCFESAGGATAKNIVPLAEAVWSDMEKLREQLQIEHEFAMRLEHRRVPNVPRQGS